MKILFFVHKCVVIGKWGVNGSVYSGKFEKSLLHQSYTKEVVLFEPSGQKNYLSIKFVYTVCGGICMHANILYPEHHEKGEDLNKEKTFYHFACFQV